MNVGEVIAVVTGGASGLGEACVRNLVKEGAKVSILDLAEETGKKLAEELGSGVIFFKTDVTDEKSVEAAIDKAAETFGGIHVAINCAGVLMPAEVLGKQGPMDMAHFNRVVQILSLIHI